MNWHERPHDALDDLLHAADWPAPSAESLERLESAWKQVARRRKRRMAAALAAAALVPCAAMVIVLAFFVARPQDGPNKGPMDAHGEIANDRSTPGVKTEPAIALSDTQATPTHETLRRQAVLEPSAYEQTVVLVYRSRMGARPVQPALAHPGLDPVGELIKRVIEEPALDIAVAARELLATCPDCEARLRQSVERSAQAIGQWRGDSATVGEHRTALRLLAQVATQDSLATLVAAARQNDCPAEALSAMVRLSSPAQLASLVRQETIAERRQIWMAGLFGRGSSQAVAAYLELVSDATTSAAALEVAKTVPTPPVDELFSALFSSRVATRQAAARLLGALNDPTVSQRLAAMVRKDVGRREALMALLSSSEPQAKAFVAQAQEDLALAPSLRALHSRLLPPESAN